MRLLYKRILDDYFFDRKRKNWQFVNEYKVLIVLETKTLEVEMPAVLHIIVVSHGQLLNPAELKPLSHGLSLLEEAPSQPDTRSQRLSENWQERKNTEHRDSEEEGNNHKLMEDVKRYIRSIDISNL